jgi:hypothetical protein
MWVSRNNTSSELNGFLPQSDRGCIIFTTRNRQLAQKLAPSNVIVIPETDEETSRELLKKSLIRPDLLQNPIIITALLQQLTSLPLAITQAAAYINANGIELADYLALLQEQVQDVVEPVQPRPVAASSLCSL